MQLVQKPYLKSEGNPSSTTVKAKKGHLFNIESTLFFSEYDSKRLNPDFISVVIHFWICFWFIYLETNSDKMKSEFHVNAEVSHQDPWWLKCGVP